MSRAKAASAPQRTMPCLAFAPRPRSIQMHGDSRRFVFSAAAPIHCTLADTHARPAGANLRDRPYAQRSGKPAGTHPAAERSRSRGDEYELLIVDDASSDNTAEVCQQLERDYPLRLHVRRNPKDGLSGAVLEGIVAGTRPNARGHGCRSAASARAGARAAGESGKRGGIRHGIPLCGRRKHGGEMGAAPARSTRASPRFSPAPSPAAPPTRCPAFSPSPRNVPARPAAHAARLQGGPGADVQMPRAAKWKRSRSISAPARMANPSSRSCSSSSTSST